MINRNIRIYLEMNDKDGFDIYLVFSGQYEYLMSHRKNTWLYECINGISVCELRMKKYDRSGMFSHGLRYKRRVRVRKYANTIDHLVDVIDMYIEGRESA